MLNILILPSVDGDNWTYAVLYPATWTPEQADAKAIEAFTAAQVAVGAHEWQWDDYEPELIKRGFTVTGWHHGPTWDETRVDEQA